MSPLSTLRPVPDFYGLHNTAASTPALLGALPPELADLVGGQRPSEKPLRLLSSSLVQHDLRAQGDESEESKAEAAAMEAAAASASAATPAAASEPTPAAATETTPAPETPAEGASTTPAHGELR